MQSVVKNIFSIMFILPVCNVVWAIDSPRDWTRLDGGPPSTTNLRKALKECQADDLARRMRNHPGAHFDLKPVKACMESFGYKLKNPESESGSE